MSTYYIAEEEIRIDEYHYADVYHVYSRNSTLLDHLISTWVLESDAQEECDRLNRAVKIKL